MQGVQKIEVSSKTIVFTILFILLLRFLSIIADLIISLLIAFILMSALKPFVSVLEKKKIPRLLAVLVVYTLFITLLSFLFSLILPPLINETTLFVKQLPDILRNSIPSLLNMANLESLLRFIPTATDQFFKFATGLFSNIVFLISTIFFGFYFLLEADKLKGFLTKFLDEKTAYIISDTIERVEKRMSNWFWGEMILMTVIGVLTYIGLSLVGLRYALSLAVLAGLLEVIPTIGPILSAIPAFFVALSYSYFLAFTSLALYFVIQQLENNLIVPFIMRRAVGIHPIITLIALVVGGKLGGIMGILLAVPIVILFETIALTWVKTRSDEKI